MMDDKQDALEVCGKGNPLKIPGFFSLPGLFLVRFLLEHTSGSLPFPGAITLTRQ